MPRRKPSAATGGVRREIASRAARMMAEDGIADYGFAKRKAAKSLGAGEGEVLPTNEEVEAELRAYQAIYQEDEHAERLHHLRQVAVEVMRLLEDFRPYLTGAVLEGTAGRYAGVDLDLYADSAKDVEIMLLSRNIGYDHERNNQSRPGAPEALLRLDWQGTPVRLSIYPYMAERRQPQGLHARARVDAVAALLLK